jgi:translation initiation factor 2 beta subunit (eIF-2beta)/eIF-5
MYEAERDDKNAKKFVWRMKRTSGRRKDSCGRFVLKRQATD